MPPAGAPRPDQSSLDGMVGWLDASLDRPAAARPDPGRPVLHRLNRAEYANAIRDLLALEIDAASLLPADESATASTTSPTRCASRRRCSSAISSAAEASARSPSAIRRSPPGATPSRTRADSHQLDHVEGLPLGTRGGLLIRQTSRSTAST